MKRLKKLIMLSLVSMSLLSAPLTVHATEVTEVTSGGDSQTTDPNDTDGAKNTPNDQYNQNGEYVIQTGDAITDIMDGQRFQGAVRSINFITEFIDIWFIRIISATAFFIISAALLKNVCAGAYVANSKFWDKVDDAHKKKDAISIASAKQFFAGGQGIMNTQVGSVRDFLLCIVPNIKAFTDFDDADIEPKAYFMKAIPQMCACVIIGIFIYNGYYRDTAAVVGETGSVVITRVLGSVNPEGLVDTLFNTTGWPDFPTKNDSSIQGRAEYEISKAIKGALASKCKDIKTAEQKAAAINNIANSVRFTTEGSFGECYSATGVGNLEGETVDWKIAGVKAINTAYIEGSEACELYEPDERGNRYFTLYFKYGGTCGSGELGIASNDVTPTDCIAVTGYFKQEMVAEVNGTSGTQLGAPTEVRGSNVGQATVTVHCSNTNSSKVNVQELLEEVIATVGYPNGMVKFKFNGQQVGYINGNGAHADVTAIPISQVEPIQVTYTVDGVGSYSGFNFNVVNGGN